MQLIGLNWVVMERTGSAASVGLSVLAGTLPSVLLGPWAGAVADRVSVRRIILPCQSLHAVLAVVLAFAVWREVSMPVIFALTATAGLVSVFDGPALGRFGAQVVSRENLGNALALGSVISSTGRILGMSSAAVLAVAFGSPALFLINAVSFAAVIVAVLTVREKELHPLEPGSREQAGVGAGLRYITASGRLVLLFALGFVLSMLLPIAAGAVVIDTTMSTRLQLDTVDGMRGRLLAVNHSVGAAAGAVGAPLLGWLCEHVGASETLVLAGTLALLATVFAATVLAAPPDRRAALAHRVLRRTHHVPVPTAHLVAGNPPVPAGHPVSGDGSTRPGGRSRPRLRVRVGRR